MRVKVTEKEEKPCKMCCKHYATNMKTCAPPRISDANTHYVAGAASQGATYQHGLIPILFNNAPSLRWCPSVTQPRLLSK